MVVVDASFISLRYLLPVIKGWLAEPAEVITLIKPQFEAGKGQVGKGGVVRDVQVHRSVLQNVLSFAEGQGYVARGLIRSPIKGPAGNIEFLAWLHHTAQDQAATTAGHAAMIGRVLGLEAGTDELPGG